MNNKASRLFLIAPLFALLLAPFAGCAADADAVETNAVVYTAAVDADTDNAAPAWTEQQVIPVSAQSPPDGIYLGLISFAGGAEELIPPVLLNKSGYDALVNLLDTRYQADANPGTALYYAIHTALANLSALGTNIPSSLKSVNIVTFTDGLDNNSTSLGLPALENRNFQGRAVGDYAAYISNELARRRIGGQNIEAFAVGVRGDDVPNDTDFNVALAAISNKGNAFAPRDYEPLRYHFERIANSFITTSISSGFSVVMPSYPAGSMIRITFGLDASGFGRDAGAAPFIEGRIAVRDGGYVITNIVYNGVTSTAGNEVVGTLDGTQVTYTFPDFAGIDPFMARQWVIGSDGAWQMNSEYRLNARSKTSTTKQSTIIYLVLDGSNSLNNTNITLIRTATKHFIDILYNRDTGTAPPVRYTSSDEKKSKLRVALEGALENIGRAVSLPSSASVAILMNRGLEEVAWFKDELRSVLETGYSYRVIEQIAADRLMAESGFRVSGHIDEQELKRIGEQLGVQFIFLGIMSEFPRVNDNIQFQEGELVVRLFDVTLGSMVSLGIGRYRW
ncbi:MAG: VWA domain-containing protein [Treponema sp.]|jgi:hypothetical protein|nr:VWA domain-containing protein [Treponema sp.]